MGSDERVFGDDAYQAEFARKGFVVARLIAEADAIVLRQRIDALRAAVEEELCSEGGLEQSFCTPGGGYRRSAYALVSAALGPPLLALLPGYRLASSGVMIKTPGAAAMDIHRDRTCLPDPEQVAVNAWCPLSDIGDDHGNLAMLPGSHRLPNVEAVGVERFYAGYGDALKRLCVSQPLKAGEAVLFDHRLLHWSRPNRHSAPRPVARAMGIPADSRIVHYRQDTAAEDSRFDLLDMESDGPAAHSPADVARGLVAAPVIGHVENRNREVSYDECRSRALEALGSPPPRSGVARLKVAMRSLGARAHLTVCGP